MKILLLFKRFKQERGAGGYFEYIILSRRVKPEVILFILEKNLSMNSLISISQF